MSKSKLIGSLVIIGAVTSVVSAHTVYAWHPVGVITKQVQNVTMNGQMQEAEDTTHAVDVKTGDILKYAITVRNDGTKDQRGYNDMASVVVTDTLPAGVELVDMPAKRTITADLGTIKPGDSVTKTYSVKVTETANLKYIENKACFTGNSTVNDNAQEGCNAATIRTNIPQILTPAVTPDKPAVKSAVTTLPKTGPASVLAVAVTFAVLAYAASLKVLSKHSRGNL